MLLLRSVVLLLLGASLVCFVAYATTGRLQYRVLGIRVVKWTIVAGLVFFGVLILERVVPFL
ncbi:MAG: hypothetical protein ABI156_13665 [Caldimonas sp.]